MALPCNWRFHSWFDDKSDTVVEFDSDRCYFFYCDRLTSGNPVCLSTAAAMLSWSHEITSKKRLLLSIFSMQRRLWRVCTFAQAHLSLRPGTQKSCAGSNNDLCTVYKNSECCGEAAPATMAHLGNHQCVVSMRQKMRPVLFNKIPQ